MASKGFTAERVNSFAFDNGGNPKLNQCFMWDTKTPGLGVRASVGGVKAYVFEGRVNGSNFRMTIGDVRSWTLADAQALARRLKTKVDQGIDPRQELVSQRESAELSKLTATRQNLTLADGWSAYLAARKGKWGELAYRDHQKMAALGGRKKAKGEGTTLPGTLAGLMSVPLIQLGADSIAQWLRQETKSRPTSAALAYRYLRAFIRWANDTPDFAGLIPASSYQARSVRDALPKSRAKPDDCLQREQLAAWFDAVTKLSNPITSAYLQALLLTGARREEMLTLRWDDVDFQWRQLRIRDKVDGTRVIPLTPYLAALLTNLQELAKRDTHEDNNEKRENWVFISKQSKSGRLADPRLAHNVALQAAGLPHVTLHGLRRSFGTLCEWVEVPAGVIAQLMGHKPSAIAERHYRRRPLDMLRMWHDKVDFREQARSRKGQW